MSDAFEGRQAQFDEMMEQLAQLQAKYKGVRGELLAKVHDEFVKLKPTRSATVTPVRAPTAARAPSPVTAAMLPSCRVCGRSMKQTNDNSLVCQNGHIRLAS